MANKIFAYVRVSTEEQKTDRQLDSIKEYCKDNNLDFFSVEVFQDHKSGKDFNREEYQNLKRCLRAGDTLIIKELDRLGRNMQAIKEEWQQMVKYGINIVVIDTPILNTSNKTDLEKSLISNIVFELLSYMAEKERLKIKSRQKEGIASAKARGEHLGRPKAEYPPNWENVYSQWKEGEITARKGMELLNLKKSTFYKLAKDWEI